MLINVIFVDKCYFRKLREQTTRIYIRYVMLIKGRIETFPVGKITKKAVWTCAFLL